ncbi:MAG: hypothetical protein JOZ57_02805 [Abitibacteriaceae bacterium]|nr:hypothetical protein [Abditibacteriaceae bacterium]
MLLILSVPDSSVKFNVEVVSTDGEYFGEFHVVDGPSDEFAPNEDFRRV